MLNRILLVLLLLISVDVSAAKPSAPDTSLLEPPAASSLGRKAKKDNAKITCAEKVARFKASQDCFAPYQNIDGTFKPGAFEHCTDMEYPVECPL